MRIEQQNHRLQVENLDNKVNVVNTCQEQAQRHGPLLPSTIRAIIVAPSNAGKTNVVISLILDPQGLYFSNVYIYSKSLYQPKYQYLQKILEPIEGLGVYTFSNAEDIVEPSNAEPDSIFIFDDIMCEKQSIIQSYFSYGRHKRIDCFYLCQTYSKVPKQLIRDNLNTLICFRVDSLNLRHIFNDHVSPDVTYEQFQKMCAECWKDDHGFLVICKDSPIDNGRYRKGFDKFIYP